MPDWRSKSGCRNISRKWEVATWRDEFGVDPKKASRYSNKANYAEAVGWFNEDMPFISDKGGRVILAFEYAVRERIKELKEHPDYLALRAGTASDNLIRETIADYYMGRECSK